MFRLPARILMIVIVCFAGLQSTQGDRSARRGNRETINAQASARFTSFNRRWLI